MQSCLGLDLQKSCSSLEKVLVSAGEVLTATLTLLNTESCVQKLFITTTVAKVLDFAAAALSPLSPCLWRCRPTGFPEHCRPRSRPSPACRPNPQTGTRSLPGKVSQKEISAQQQTTPDPHRPSSPSVHSIFKWISLPKKALQTVWPVWRVFTM